MKFRYSAAIVLVGWLLIAPPPIGRAKDYIYGSSIPGGFATIAPLWTWWRIGKIFDSVAACNEARLGYLNKLNADSKTQPNPELDKIKLQMSASQCVASDDRRLQNYGKGGLN
jgi:hypothetical protein